MREIENHLVVGIGMDRRHGADDDLEIVMHDFNDGGQTVGGAGCVRNDVVLGRIVNLFIYSQHQGNVFILCRRGDDDFFDRPAQMLLGIIGVGETSGRFEHDLNADGFTWKLGLIFLAENLKDVTVDSNGVGSGRDLIAQVSENGVVLEQVGERLGAGEIVDRDEFNVRIFQRSAQDIASDASKAVDAYFNSHLASVSNDEDTTEKNAGPEPQNVNREREAQQM